MNENNNDKSTQESSIPKIEAWHPGMDTPF